MSGGQVGHKVAKGRLRKAMTRLMSEYKIHSWRVAELDLDGRSQKVWVQGAHDIAKHVKAGEPYYVDIPFDLQATQIRALFEIRAKFAA